MSTRIKYDQLKDIPFKKPCRVATTGNVSDLASGAPNIVDDISLSIDDRVLVKSQGTSSLNGVYRVVTVGTGSNGSWTRDYDFTGDVDVYDGVGLFITSGTTNANSLYYLTSQDPIVIGSSSLTFSEFSGGGVSGGATGFGSYWTTSSHIGSMNIFVTASGDVRYIDFDTTVVNNTQLGRLSWNVDDGTLNIGLNNDVVLQTGQEQHYYVKNQTGGTLLNGRVVAANGTVGVSGMILVTYSIADGSIDSHQTMGILTQDILNGDDGYVTEFGKVRNIDTTGTPYGETWSDGDELWLSPTIPGGLTNIRPEAPNHKTLIALVIEAGANGTLFVRPTFGSNLASDEQVEYNVNNLVDNSLLVWNDTNGRWEQGTFSTLLSLNNGLTGSGTTNYVPRWLSPTTLSSTSSIYDSGTAVSIGYTASGAVLDVKSIDTTNASFRIRNSVNTGNIFKISGDGGFDLGDSNYNAPVKYFKMHDTTTRGANDIFFDIIGNAGQPAFRAWHGSGAGTSPAISIGGAQNNISTYNTAVGLGVNRFYGVNHWSFTRPAASQGWVRIGIESGSLAALHVDAQGTQSSDLAFIVRNNQNTDNIMQVQGDGFVSFGTASPAAKLDIYAHTASSTASVFRVSGIPTIYLSGSYSLFTINGDGSVVSRNNSFTPSFKINYDSAGIEKTAFHFTTLGYNGPSKAWTFASNYDSQFYGLEMYDDQVGADQNYFQIKFNNFSFGGPYISTLGTTDRKVLYLSTGVSPTMSISDGIKFYSKDIVAGNAAPHFITENGSVIRLYNYGTVSTAQGIADALTSIGILGTSSITGSTFNKYATTISNGSITSNVPITVTHSLSTTDISVTAWDVSLDEVTYPKFSNRTTSTVDVTFTSVPTGDVRIVIMA